MSQPATADTQRAQDLDQLDNVPQLLTTAEAADWLGVTSDTVAKYCREGKIPDAAKTGSDGGEWRIPASSLTEAQSAMRVGSDQDQNSGEVELDVSYKEGRNG